MLSRKGVAVALLLATVFGASLPVRSEDVAKRLGKVTWRKDADAALAEAKRVGRPVLIWFTHDGCECDHERGEAELFASDGVARASSSYVCVFVNVSTEPKELTAPLVERFGIRGYASGLVLDAEGRVICEARHDARGLEAQLRSHAGGRDATEQPEGAPSPRVSVPRLVLDWVRERAERTKGTDEAAKTRATLELTRLKEEIDLALEGKTEPKEVQLGVSPHGVLTHGALGVEFGCIGEREICYRITGVEPARVIVIGPKSRIEAEAAADKWVRFKLPEGFGRPQGVIVTPRRDP